MDVPCMALHLLLWICVSATRFLETMTEQEAERLKKLGLGSRRGMVCERRMARRPRSGCARSSARPQEDEKLSLSEEGVSHAQDEVSSG